MPANPTGIKLLSALRKAKSKSSLYETPESYFEEGDELNAFNWLKTYVQTYNAFPTPMTFRQETGLTTVITGEPVAYYANDARKRALYQIHMGAFGELRDRMESQDPDGFVEMCRQVVTSSQELNHRREGLVTLSESIQMVRDDYVVAKNTLGLRGIPTPWDFLNEITDGWQNADVITFVARPGRGKTMFLLYCAWVAWKAGYSVLFLSMEMGVVQLARRMFGMNMGVDPTFIRRGNLGTMAEREMHRQMDLMQGEETPFYWLAGNFKKTIPALRAAAYETEADIIFADASYLLKPESTRYKASGRRELIADVIEEIGGLCKELNRPIIQSVQFNRQGVRPKKGEDEENRNDPISHLALEKIGETDVVGQVSSIVFGLELGDKPHEDDERYCGLLKGREGERGWMKVHYKFRPFNMGYLTDHRHHARREVEAVEAPDLSYMDVQV